MNMCVDMCIGVCIDLCIDMCIDMSIDINCLVCRPTPHVMEQGNHTPEGNQHVYERVFSHLYSHLYRHAVGMCHGTAGTSSPR